MNRRQLLRSAAGGLAGILASRRGPAHAQTTRLHLLFRVDFIPQGEAELKRQLADYGKQMKMEVTLETINENDLQTRITAAIQSGAGADIVQMLHNWPHLYGPALADMTELADWKERDQGKFYAQSEAAARDSSRWLGLPHCITPALVNYRKSWFAEVGSGEPPLHPGQAPPRHQGREGAAALARYRPLPLPRRTARAHPDLPRDVFHHDHEPST
jgi:multiple sugar transport system substrate-binding protein